MKQKIDDGQLRKPSSLPLDKSFHKLKDSINKQEINASGIKRRLTLGKETRLIVASSPEEFREHEDLQRQLRSMGSFTSKAKNPEKMTFIRYASRFIISPQSAKRRTWDFLTAVFVIYMVSMFCFHH